MGLPYSFHVSLVTDDNTGNLLQGSGSGAVEKVPLPDGGLFITAGRIDWTLHTDQDVVIVPDIGHSGNVAAFCAALS